MKYSASENCIRSVGAPPNGVLGLRGGDALQAPYWSVNHRVNPTEVGANEIEIHVLGHDENQWSEPISTDELLDAGGPEEAYYAWAVARTILSVVAQNGDFGQITAHYELCREVHEGILARRAMWEAEE